MSDARRIAVRMEWTITIGAIAFVALAVSGYAQARRGIGRWSLVPWDYVMICAAVILLAAAAHLAILWRDS